MLQAFAQRHPILTATLLALLVVAPFLNSRVMRAHGDEKVYVSQAVEMEQQNTWWQQKLFGEGNYYKGPLHLQSVILGSKFFGHTDFALVWLNLLLMLAAVAALSHMILHTIDNAWWAMAGGLSFAVAGGTLPYLFTSQMEFELAAWYLLVLFVFLKDRPDNHWSWLLWVMIGLAGWFKSPLHAALLGTSVLGYWLYEGSLWQRIRQLSQWGALISGVVVGVLGYLPAYLLDSAAFTETYLIRETFGRKGNLEPWYTPLLPLFSYFMLPWLAPLVAALISLVRRDHWRRLTSRELKLVRVCLAFMLPGLVFFTAHKFRNGNYNVPLVGIFMIVVLVYWHRFWLRLWRLAILPAGILYGSAAIFVAVLAARIFGEAPWWPTSATVYVGMGGVATLAGCMWVLIKGGPARPLRGLLILSPALAGILTASSLMGEAEMLDLRAWQQRNPQRLTAVFNPERHIWSEWGALNFWTDQPVTFATTAQTAHGILDYNGALLLTRTHRADEQLAELFANGGEFQIEVWRRWATKIDGMRPGEVVAQAWQDRDHTILWRPALIITKR